MITWVEHRRGMSRVVCGFCHEYGAWRSVVDWQTTRDERAAHAAVCGPWREFCDLWWIIAWDIGRRAPYYWSHVNPPPGGVTVWPGARRP